MAKTLGQKKCDNRAVVAWVEEIAQLCEPDEVFWCDGSKEEKEHLTERAVREGVLQPLDRQKWPGCHYHRSKQNDVARVEDRTFICTPSQDEAGPTNNWASPDEMYAKLRGLLKGAHKGRTMFVVPYLMGPAGSPLTKVGIELTDSIYVVLSMRIMARIGNVAWEHLGDG